MRRIRPWLAPEEGAERVRNYLRVWPVFQVGGAHVAEAVRGCADYQLNYWDALIWATARLNDIPLVLSEDFSEGAVLGGVRFRNPFAPDFELSRARGRPD